MGLARRLSESVPRAADGESLTEFGGTVLRLRSGWA